MAMIAVAMPQLNLFSYPLNFSSSHPSTSFIGNLFKLFSVFS
ncbi:Hypothetical protein Eab7_1327 [Exiguobacterium antarcticum B7]|nr:Hypothetical protein Eab7_1327 [Exiguobacterium antarcticum B7]